MMSHDPENAGEKSVITFSVCVISTLIMSLSFVTGCWLGVMGPSLGDDSLMSLCWMSPCTTRLETKNRDIPLLRLHHGVIIATWPAQTMNKLLFW